MKRAGNYGEEQNNGRIPDGPGSGKLTIAFSGSEFKIRRVEVGTRNNIQVVSPLCFGGLPLDLYKPIFEYLVGNVPSHQQFLSLLKVSEVCKSFNATINCIIEERLSSSTDNKRTILFGRMLVSADEWIIPAIYYSCSLKRLAADICQNTQVAKDLFQIYDAVSTAFEAKIFSLGKSESKIVKTSIGYNVECNGVVIKFNGSNASISALNVFIQSHCCSKQILQCRSNEQSDLIDFLVKYNSKENLSKIIVQQVSFFCDQCYGGHAVLSVGFLISLLKRGLIDQESIPDLMKCIFTILQNHKTASADRSYMLRLLSQLLRMNLVKLHPQDVQFLRAFVFAEFSAPIDPNFPVQRQDAAMGMIQEFIAAGYTLDLTAAEMKILKDHAIERLAYQYGDVDFKHDILELLGFITQREEWFSLVSVPLFECILSLLIKSNQQYSPFQTQRLITFYDILIKHPEEIICSLATQISIFIKGGALALKNHLLIMLQDSSSTLITRNRKLALLEDLLKANSIRLEESELQIVKNFVFSDLSVISNNSMQKNDLAIMILHNLLTSDYSLALTNFELEALKAYANIKFKDETVDLLIQQNLIELLLHFVPETTQLFPIVSLKFFEGIKSFILSNKKIYTPSIAQKLTKIYDQFLEHPNQQIAFLAADISLLIAGILPDEV